MKQFKPTGFSFCVDPNIAFFYDNQNPAFDVKYVNNAGEIKTRKYQAEIKSLGLKFELTFKFNLIFFVGTDLDFYNTNKKIELGLGIDIESNIIDFTYASFKNAPGGIIILGIPIPQIAITGPTTFKLLSNYSQLNENMALDVQQHLETNFPTNVPKTPENIRIMENIAIFSARATSHILYFPGFSIVFNGSLTPIN